MEDRRFIISEVLVCLDECETRQPRSRPGAARAYDYEYQRNGVSNLFMLFGRWRGGAGWKGFDWARVRKLVDEDYGQRPDRTSDGQSEHPSPSVPVRGI